MYSSRLRSSYISTDMASHDQLVVAPGMTPDAVTAAAPAVAPIVALDGVPIVAPHAVPILAHCAAYGGARTAAHGGARGRAHCAAHVLALGTTPSSVGPGMAPGAVPVPGQAAPIAPAGGPIAPPPCIDIDALSAFSKQEVARLQQSILSSDDGIYRDICATICRSL